MFTYFKAAEYVASSFLFLLLLSVSLNVSEGCLSATDGLHKTLIRIQRDHMARIQTSGQQPDNAFIWVPMVSSFSSFLPFLSLCPRNPKSRQRNCSETTSYLMSQFLLTTGSCGLPKVNLLGLTPGWPWTHPCRRKSPPQEIFLRSIHWQVGLALSKLPGKGNTDSHPWKRNAGRAN